jgi:hypothetical protein
LRVFAARNIPLRRTKVVVSGASFRSARVMSVADPMPEEPSSFARRYLLDATSH